MTDATKTQLREQLCDLLGPRRFVPFDRRNTRFGIAQPETTAELQQIARLTHAVSLPLIPRGANTNPFAGPEPNEGLIVSFDKLSRILGVYPRTHVATVQPGVIWHTLLEHLAERRVTACVYPSSEGYSTVGGFVAQGGVGIGSYQFGDMLRTVARVRLMDALGDLHLVRGPQLRIVVGAQGRTGLIVEVTLRLQDLAPNASVIALFDTFHAATETIARAAEQALPIWSVNVMDPAAADLASRNRPDLSLPERQYAALFTFKAGDTGTVTTAIGDAARATGGRLLEVTHDAYEWLIQFASLQALGTTPIPMQFRVPLARASKLLDNVPQDLRQQLAIEAIASDAGKSMALRLFFRDLQTSADANQRAARQLVALVREAGGTAYSTGSVYLDEAEAVFGTERLWTMRAFQETIDPDHRLNPGRAFP